MNFRKLNQCSIEKKQGIILSAFNPKLFVGCTSTMIYQTISLSLRQHHVELELSVYRNSSRMLQETCITQFLILYYIYINTAMETFESIFFKEIRNEPK